MVDVVDPATRSRMMSGIRAKNTCPEIFLRKKLHALGFRFRLHAKEISGKPDIVLPKYRALVVIHGCFWHGHDCKYFKLPKTNPDFWRQKIDANRQRDNKNRVDQRSAGWRILEVWECAIRASMKTTPTIDVGALTASWLCSNSPSATIDEGGIKEG